MLYFSKVFECGANYLLHYVVNVTTGPRVAIDARGDGEACSEGI